jgi:hypothetical protein
MTTAAAVLPPAVVKEIRALFPTYVAALIAVAVGSLGLSHTLIAAGLLGFAFGSVALGAQSFGHEYSHRTLGLLLSQPLDRRRLFLYKLAVLFVMLLTLTAAALLMFRDVLLLAASPHTEPSMLVLAAACGLFVAPWLTMLCRSTLAAVVFTIAIPGVLATASGIAGSIIYGLQNAAAIDRFTLLVFWRGMVVICALAGVAGWRMFMRLEVIDGHGSDVQLPASLRARSATIVNSLARPRHRVWMLVAKEMHLQQMALVVAAIYAILWVAGAWLQRGTHDSPGLPEIPMTMLYVGVLSMLIGSLASAEERHLGTLEWQILLPMPAWQQWAVKISVAFGLVALLGVGLPAVLGYLTLRNDDLGPFVWRRLALTMVPLTTGSLYISTLCRSGVGAMVLSFPTFVAAALFAQTAGSLLWRVWFPAGSRRYVEFHDTTLLLYAVGGGLVALLLWLAFRNHRSADRSAARTSKQVVAIASSVTVGVLILLGLR